jgi:WD40 repeat protein
MGPASEALTIETADSHGRIAFSPDGTAIAAGDLEAVKVWDVATGNERVSLETPAFATGVALDPHGSRLAGATETGEVMLWNLASGKKELEFKASDTLIMFLAFSPDGKRLATASRDGAEVWDASNGELIQDFPGAEVLSVCFSPDGRRLLATDTNNQAVIWDVDRDESLVAVAHEGIIWGCAFSPDGKRFATASADGTARIWDASSGEELPRLIGHTSTVVSVFFSPDGKQLATTGRDGVTKLWDANSGELLLNLYGDGEGLNGVAISPDGSRLATAGTHALHVYLLRLPDLMVLARSRLTRELTAEECQEYLHANVCPVSP